MTFLSVTSKWQFRLEFSHFHSFISYFLSLCLVVCVCVFPNNMCIKFNIYEIASDPEDHWDMWQTNNHGSGKWLWKWQQLLTFRSRLY